MNPDSSTDQQPLPPSLPRIIQPWLRVVLFLAANLTLLSVLVALLFWGMDESEFQTDLEELYLIQIISLFVTCITVWLFRTYFDKSSILSLGFEWTNRVKDSVIGFGLGFALIAVGTLLLMLLGELEISAIQFNFDLLLSYFILCIIIALNEEILVRGYVLNNLMQSMNKYWALVVSAMIFTLFHALNPNISFLAVVNLQLAGMLLGIYYIHQQNLWFPIALHTSWNFSEGAVFGYEVSGIDFQSLLQQNISDTDWLTGGEFGFEGSLLLSILLGLAILTTHKLYSPKT
ncbi:MAG: type II CAAX endopeptidase family protein [Chitinophagales bacterium]